MSNLQKPYLLKDWLAQFGRLFALLLNRSLMYQTGHPMVREALKDVMATVDPLLERSSPLVFILNRNQFYVDDQAIDERINVKRIHDLFKAIGIESISFEKGCDRNELDTFIVLFAGLNMNSKLDELKAALSTRGVYSIRINHVIYKKVTSDDQIVSREALKNVSPFGEAEDPENQRKFMDALLQSVLADDLAGTLNITHLLNDPAAFSRQLIATDLAGARRLEISDERSPNEAAPPAAGLTTDGADAPMGAAGAAASSPGRAGLETGHKLQTASLAEDGAPAVSAAFTASQTTPAADGGQHSRGILLLHQLERIQQEVHNHLQGHAKMALDELAQAVSEMKRHLLEGLETQKTVGEAYANEAAIIARADRLTDGVLITLIREEYRNGALSGTRLALLIRRLIPSAEEIRRLLPQIKVALLAEGLPISGFLQLLHELQNELRGEDLARVLDENAAAIGLDGGSIIDEIKRNPAQAAELIYLASEIRQEKGAENALSDILVEYVEQLSQNSTALEDRGAAPPDENHVKKVMQEVESKVLKQLSRLNVKDEVLLGLEQRLNQRMQTIMDKMRAEWLNAQASRRAEGHLRSLSLLQTLEQNAAADEEMSAILGIVRQRVAVGKVDENNFVQIQAEIERQKRKQKESGEGSLPDEVLSANELMFILEKEIARCKRYAVPFAALALSFVTARAKSKELQEDITADLVVNAALEKLTVVFRDMDYIGQVGRNKMLVVLPMTAKEQARKALGRVINALHAAPLDVNGVAVDLRVAGVAAAYDKACPMDAREFSRHLSNQLMDMVARVKNIQVLF